MNWININDQQPQLHESVLVCDGTFIYMAHYNPGKIENDGCSYHQDVWCLWFCKCPRETYPDKINYWLKLPKPNYPK
jgi:hypothetical protein